MRQFYFCAAVGFIWWVGGSALGSVMDVCADACGSSYGVLGPIVFAAGISIPGVFWLIADREG